METYLPGRSVHQKASLIGHSPQLRICGCFPSISTLSVHPSVYMESFIECRLTWAETLCAHLAPVHSRSQYLLQLPNCSLL